MRQGELDGRYLNKPLITNQFLQTAENNERAAVRWGNDLALSWDELRQRSLRLAEYLVEERGVARGDCVAVGYARSCEFMIATYAVLLAGAVYCPIDPKQPKARLASMLKTAQCRIAFGGDELGELAVGELCELSLIDEDACHTISSQPSANPGFTGVELDSNDGAYLIFTSGTTGTPKGVLVSHGALINRLHWHLDHSQLQAADVILQRTAVTFDVSLWELFLPALAGASHYLLQPGFEVFPKALVMTLQSARASVVHFVPSLLKPLLQELAANEMTAQSLPSLRQVYVSGEALLPELVKQFHAFFGDDCRLTNLYGPTEAAIDVTYFDCVVPEISAVPIGYPLTGCQLHVIDPESMQLKAPGEVGELAISGICLADGYMQQQALTDSVFVQHETLRQRIYLTGDLGWQDPEQEYFFWSSRKDTQVKLNGLRIELGEIEHHLIGIADVNEAVVVVVNDQSGQQRLVAAVQGALTEESHKDMRKLLSSKVPGYMIPSRFWIAEALPRGSSGKHDRKQIAQRVQSLFFAEEDA